MKFVRVNVRPPGTSTRAQYSILRPSFQAYHGVTAGEHQTNSDKWSALGYRIISLSVYGDPDSPLYAAVWIQRPGPAWQAVHGVDAVGYQTFFNASTAAGYVPVLISVTGAFNNAVFAAVFEQGINGPWLARHGMPSGPAANAGTFQNENANALACRLMLRSVAIYGTAGDRRYAAVWHSNPGYVKWHLHPSDSGANYQVKFDAETQLAGYELAAYRPAYVALSRDLLYCSVFRDDVVGSWVARHEMTAGEYQAEFDHQVANGFYPICVQGGGSTRHPVYAAVFAEQDVPLSREWTIAGQEIPQLAELDQVMQRFMQANGVRAAQLAIARDGVMFFSRAYTWAEPGYRITQLSTRFLLGSCSKIFLEAAVQSLYDDGRLAPTAKVYPLLGFSGPLDPRSDTIAIQQLLDHSGGYDDASTGSGFDATYNLRAIALALELNHPVTKLDVARYMYGRMLDFTPGTEEKYSSYGYLLAGAVVEHVTGKSYFDYLTERLLPAGTTEVKVVSTPAARRSADEAIAEDQGLGLSPIDLYSPSLVPFVYGGDGAINEVGEANDGTGASAQALVHFIHRHAVWGNGPRTPGYTRTGSTPGASSLAASRTDGIDWAYVINTRDWPPSTSPTLTDLGSAISEVLDRMTAGRDDLHPPAEVRGD
jgi:CubicO group peptidase (beta-lactamase class C family)